MRPQHRGADRPPMGSLERDGGKLVSVNALEITKGETEHMRSMVILGAGQAGGWTAKTLRDQGFAGSIVLIGEETHPPYERPPLSKDVLLRKRNAESTYLWSADKLAELGLECLFGVRATDIDRLGKVISLSDGKSVRYDKLLIATGSRPRTLVAPGAEIEGIRYLRNIEDALALRGLLRSDTRLLIVGGGWIGLEVAAAARQRGAEVVVVEAASQLCQRVLPSDLAGLIQRYHEDRGVRFVLGATATKFIGDRRIQAVQLSNGARLQTDTVLIGIGAIPNAELAQAGGIEVENGIVVDASGRTSDAAIFAAGDVANQPNRRRGRARIESWSNAQNQAIATAKAMLDVPSTYDDLPYFWSDQFDLKVQIVGTFGSFDDAVIRGDTKECKFVKCFLKDGSITTAVGFNASQDIAILRRLMQRNVKFECSGLIESPNLKELLRSAANQADQGP